MSELLYGGPGHKPISSVELTEWSLVWQIRADEQEKAAKRARRK